VKPELEGFLKTRGVQLSALQKDKLSRYRDLLFETSGSLNLLSARDRLRIEDVHFADSLAPLDLIPKDVKAADWGSGGGLPGIPLAIARADIHVTLVESRKKKAAFLLRVIRELQLPNVKLFPRRGENLQEDFGLITVRAIGTIKELLPMVERHLRENGAVLFYKGVRLEEELRDANELIEELGFKRQEEKVLLPISQERRYLLLFK
jgi:16S rRNA (guanine527-N7)-methyltransferase